jgi:Rrf2 family protein
MKLGTRARYSLRMMIALGHLQNGGKPVTLNAIADRTGISRRYLDQLTVSLKNASLLKGHSGRDGGYTLGRPTREIRIGDIIQAAIGPIAIVECVTDPDACVQGDLCPCMPLWTLINERIVSALAEYSLADLLDKRWQQKVSRAIQPAPER